MVEQSGELHPLPFLCCLAHTRQPPGYANLAQCRVRAGWMSVLLDQRPSLLTFRRWLAIFVQAIHRYCSAVRLLKGVHVGRTAIAFSHRPVVWFTSGTFEVSRFSCMELPDVHGVFTTTQDRPGTCVCAPARVAFRFD